MVGKFTKTRHTKDKEIKANMRSVAMGPTRHEILGSSYPVEDSMLVDSGCTDHILTNIDAFLDFVPTQSVVRNPCIGFQSFGQAV